MFHHTRSEGYSPIFYSINFILLNSLFSFLIQLGNPFHIWCSVEIQFFSSKSEFVFPNPHFPLVYDVNTNECKVSIYREIFLNAIQFHQVFPLISVQNRTIFIAMVLQYVLNPPIWIFFLKTELKENFIFPDKLQKNVLHFSKNSVIVLIALSLLVNLGKIRFSTTLNHPIWNHTISLWLIKIFIYDL